MNVALINGEIVDINQPVITLQDRGYNFGDGVYEVTPFYNKRCFTLVPHMERLFNSMKSLHIPATYTMEELIEFHERLIEASGLTQGYIYLQVTRGEAPRAHPFPEQVIPCLTMHVHEINESQIKLHQEQGVVCISQPDLRWLRCDIKSLNLLGAVLAKQKAKEAGVFESILYRDSEIITEGSSSNFMVVKDGILWTHPANNLVLNGITRRVILEKICPELKLSFVEKAFDLNFVKTVDEAFVTASTIGATPVIRVDKFNIGSGDVGPITKNIQRSFNEFIKLECFAK